MELSKNDSNIICSSKKNESFLKIWRMWHILKVCHTLWYLKIEMGTAGSIFELHPTNFQKMCIFLRFTNDISTISCYLLWFQFWKKMPKPSSPSCSSPSINLLLELSFTKGYDFKWKSLYQKLLNQSTVLLFLNYAACSFTSFPPHGPFLMYIRHVMSTIHSGLRKVVALLTLVFVISLYTSAVRKQSNRTCRVYGIFSKYVKGWNSFN